MVILGDGEMESKTVSLRARNGDQVAGLGLDEFVDQLNNEIESKYVQPMLVPVEE